MPGWALNVLKDLIMEEKMKAQTLHATSQPEIRIFTLVSDRKTLDGVPITTVFPWRLNHLFTTRLDYRNLIVFAPCLMRILSRKIKKYIERRDDLSHDVELIQRDKPNEIYISSFAIAKNISLSTFDFGPSTKLYLHSPMQYIRSHYEEYTHKLKWWKGRLFKKIVPRLRARDTKFTKFDSVYSNSNYTAKLAKEIYGLNATVKYPIVHCHCEWNEAICTESLPYYIYTGRLVKFVKEVDKIIELFNHTHDPLIIIGSGPDEAYLKSIAHPNIIFVDWTDDKKEIYKILAQSRWFINLTKESFWISTAEALLLGVPVFGYDEGATPELVDEDSWVLVNHKDLHALISKFDEFKSKQRDREKISEHIKSKLGTI